MTKRSTGVANRLGKRSDSLVTRRRAARTLVMPAILASKNGKATPVYKDDDGLEYYKWVNCDRVGLGTRWNRGYGPKRDPWSNMSESGLEFIETHTWVPADPMTPLEQLAKAAGSVPI